MNSRTQNTKKNIIAGLIQRFVSIILPFVNRTVILYVLGAEYTGLTGLFSSILEVLNIAELGFNTAIVYSLYKPMAENDHDKIRELVSLFRKIYTIVGTVILGIGLCVMPFLPKLINGSYPNDINIYLLFFLYLINAAASYYLFAYKECLLIADQKRNISDNIRTIVNVCRYLAQFLVLLITHNFYLYVVVSIVGTIITNLFIQYETKKRYSFFYGLKGRIEFPQTIKNQVKGLLVDRLGDTCRNSFDSIIITSFLGLTATAIYGNYYYIYAALYAIMLVMCNAMGASVGNSIVKESVQKNYNDINKFTFIFSWIAGWCTVCLACMYQPFMALWAGKELLLPERDMFLFCLYFYIINMTNIRNQYISGTGIWWRLKIPCAIEAFANLGLNVVLGKFWGITGVLIATIVTIFGLNFVWRTSILFKHYFVGSPFINYLRRYIYYLCVGTFATAITYLVSLKIDFGWKGLLIRLMICFILPNIVFYVFYKPLKQFSECKAFVLTIINR